MSPRLVFTDKNLYVFDTEDEGELNEDMNSIDQDEWGNDNDMDDGSKSMSHYDIISGTGDTNDGIPILAGDNVDIPTNL